MNTQDLTILVDEIQSFFFVAPNNYTSKSLHDHSSGKGLACYNLINDNSKLIISLINVCQRPERVQVSCDENMRFLVS